MNGASSQLTELIDELQDVNRELAEAAEPLQRLSDLDFNERDKIARRMRAGLARWETISQRIAAELREAPQNNYADDAWAI